MPAQMAMTPPADPPPIDRLRAYRARLVKAGRLLESRAVERCIALCAPARKAPKAPAKEFPNIQ